MQLKKLDMAVIIVVFSVMTWGLMMATDSLSLAPRNMKFELLSLSVLFTGALVTYVGIRINSSH